MLGMSDAAQLNGLVPSDAFLEGRLAGANEWRANAQAFFSQLAAEIRRPSYGVMQKDFVENLLKRAQEAGLYVPPETP